MAIKSLKRLEPITHLNRDVTEITSLQLLKLFKYLCILREKERGAERGEESQADSTLSAQSQMRTGLDLTNVITDLSRNQELDAQPTEPPKRPTSTKTFDEKQLDADLRVFEGQSSVSTLFEGG